MQRSPLLDESEGCPRDLPANRRPVVDANNRFVFGVNRVKVRRIVIGEAHIDHDSVELTEPRHDDNLQRVIQGCLALHHVDNLRDPGSRPPSNMTFTSRNQPSTLADWY
jgi:hypothetical protein